MAVERRYRWLPEHFVVRQVRPPFVVAAFVQPDRFGGPLLGTGEFRLLAGCGRDGVERRPRLSRRACVVFEGGRGHERYWCDGPLHRQPRRCRLSSAFVVRNTLAPSRSGGRAVESGGRRWPPRRRGVELRGRDRPAVVDRRRHGRQGHPPDDCTPGETEPAAQSSQGGRELRYRPMPLTSPLRLVVEFRRRRWRRWWWWWRRLRCHAIRRGLPRRRHTTGVNTATGQQFRGTFAHHGEPVLVSGCGRWERLGRRRTGRAGTGLHGVGEVAEYPRENATQTTRRSHCW